MPDKSKLLLIVDIIDNFRTKGVVLRKNLEKNSRISFSLSIGIILLVIS